jgi:hypothetical protein
MRYLLTHSGQQVSRDHGTPTIEDIALGLSRQPRFGGQGRTDGWSVLDHSMFVESLAHQHTLWCLTPQDAARLRLHALLHDAHEGVISDIPSPYKSESMKALQQAMDKRIFAALVPEDADMWLHDIDIIERLDWRALLAEAMVVGPPKLLAPEDVLHHFGALPYENDVAKLAQHIGINVGQSIESRRVEFIARYEYLLNKLREPAKKTALKRTQELAEERIARDSRDANT